MARPSTPPPGAIAHSGPWRRGPYESIQVNVDEFGDNILGDAANEPSIAIDPTDPNKIVIGWRQFDTVASNFRQAGYGYSHDGGQSWTFPGSLTPGVFGSDPVLDVDSNGVFYYVSINFGEMRLFRSFDGGLTWDNPPIHVTSGLADKEWMAVDRTGSISDGHVYLIWSAPAFKRSTDGGVTFEDSVTPPTNSSIWGTLSVDAAGTLYIVDAIFRVISSANAMNPAADPSFSVLADDLLDGFLMFFAGGPNPGGLLGQAWIAVDRSFTATRGNIYVLGSVSRAGSDPMDVMFARSTDGGATWSEPIQVNDEPDDGVGYQWFGTLSVAPNGRLDVIWNDTKNTGQSNMSELTYAFSLDAGQTWSSAVPVSPVFDSVIGWPSQNKIGDYYDMVSDLGGVNIAYAATFNGEQDVYFLRIEVEDCNENGTPDADDIATGSSTDCDGNGVPDECQNDCNNTGVADRCDVLTGTSEDCNGNRVPDECDPDYDGDGITDLCDADNDNDGIENEEDACPLTPLVGPRTDDGHPRSDTNRNCFVDLTDYARLRTCLNNSGPGVAAPLETCLSVFDYDDDGDVDVFDAARFIHAFTGIP